MTVWKDRNRAKAGKPPWIAKFQHQKKQHKKEGFKTRAAAKAWEVAELERLKNPEPSTMRLTFSQVSTKYLTYCQGRFQKNTWRQKAFVYRSFIAFLGEDLVTEAVTKEIISDYLENRRSNSGNTAANRDLRDLKAMYAWAIRQDLLLKNPCFNIERYPEEPKARYVPPAEDIDKVLMAANPEEMDLLLCLYHTAGRLSEILRLSWNDVNFEHRWVRLWTRKRRGGELQEDKLAMTETLQAVLTRRWENRDKAVSWVFSKNGKQYTKSQLARTMERLCKRARVKRFGFHAIRHHVAAILRDSGKATLGQIQKFLRHHRATTTDNYLKGLSPDLIEVAEVLDNVRGQNGRASANRRA